MTTSDEHPIANPSSDHQDLSDKDSGSIPLSDTIPLKDNSSPEHETHVSFSQSNLVTIGCAAEREEESDDVMGSRKSLGFGSIGVHLDSDSQNDAVQNPKKWGWVVVIASWIVMIPIAGSLTSFGIFLDSICNEFNATKTETGLIGSLVFGFTVGSCPLSSALITVFGARKLAFSGVLGGTVSLIITSITPNLYLMFLTYSTMVGLSSNFIYNSAMTLTGMYFPKKHQAMATCLASAGVSFGTLLINPLSSVLEEAYGWRWTMRILAGIVLCVGIICVITFKPVQNNASNKKRKTSENGALMENGEVEEKDERDEPPTESRISLAAKEIKKNVLNTKAKKHQASVCYSPTCHLWNAGTFLWAVSFLFPFIFLIDYMESNLGIPKSDGALVLTAYGVAEFGGRLLCALFAGKASFSLTYIYAGASCFAGVATLLVPFGTSLPALYSYAIAAGLAAGTLNALMFVTTMQLFGNDRGIAVWGYINVMLAIGMVGGPGVAGMIKDATESYVTAFYVGGGLFLVGSLVMFLIPLAAKFEKKKLASTYQENNNHQQEETKKKPIVKRDALLKQAQKNSASKNGSKWNGDVQKHLDALDAIENEINNDDLYLISKTEQNGNGNATHH